MVFSNSTISKENLIAIFKKLYGKVDKTNLEDILKKLEYKSEIRDSVIDDHFKPVIKDKTRRDKNILAVWSTFTRYNNKDIIKAVLCKRNASIINDVLECNRINDSIKQYQEPEESIIESNHENRIVENESRIDIDENINFDAVRVENNLNNLELNSCRKEEIKSSITENKSRTDIDENINFNPWDQSINKNIFNKNSSFNENNDFNAPDISMELVGATNLGNSCFMNSLLQTIFNLRKFVD